MKTIKIFRESVSFRIRSVLLRLNLKAKIDKSNRVLMNKEGSMNLLESKKINI